MTKIETLEEAENFIYNYNLYQSKAENQAELYAILKQCEQLSLDNNNGKLLCNTRIFLTGYYTQVNDLENALHIGLDNKKLAESEGLKNEKTICYSILINLYHLLGDYANAEELIQLMNSELLDSNNFEKLSGLHIIMAIQYNNLKDYRNCIKANEKALDYALKSNNINLQIYAYSNYGYQLMNYDIEISKRALENALTVIQKDSKKIPAYSVAIVELNSSRLYLKLKDFNLSNRLIKSSINRLKKINNNTEINYAKLVLAELYVAQNKFRKAFLLLKDIEENSILHKNKSDLLSCYQNYILYFEKKKKYKDALEYYKKAQVLNEEIFNEESNKKIRNLQILNEVNTIKRQRDHAETIANLKHDFLANMSHEIRTPINSVLGICYLLQQGVLDDKQMVYIHRLQKSGENLLGLINDILDISKIEAGKMDLVITKFNFQTLLNDVFNQLLYKAEEKELAFKLNIEPSLNTFITGDSNRLTQILINLVSNSLKFTSKGSIELSASVKELNSRFVIVQIKIADTGIGIPSDKLGKIFERYEQASATIKTHFGGTGLGLSISKKLVELMNGTIQVESLENEGTTFTLHIPFELIDGNHSDNEDNITSEFLSNKRILIADDIEENRLVIKDILNSFNSTLVIEEATNGIDVLKKLSSASYDLILMDMDMPEKDGLETISDIRNSMDFVKIKVIAHTASLLTMSKEEILNLGFDELLLKPFKPFDLLNKLYLLLN
jgi:signal transduction histidine kinase